MQKKIDESMAKLRELSLGELCDRVKNYDLYHNEMMVLYSYVGFQPFEYDGETYTITRDMFYTMHLWKKAW
jgi:hypothetical protein